MQKAPPPHTHTFPCRFSIPLSPPPLRVEWYQTFFCEIRKWTFDRSGVILEGQFLLNAVWQRMSIKTVQGAGTLLFKICTNLIFTLMNNLQKKNEKLKLFLLFFNPQNYAKLALSWTKKKCSFCFKKTKNMSSYRRFWKSFSKPIDDLN